jgi:hypothetical protein
VRDGDGDDDAACYGCACALAEASTCAIHEWAETTANRQKAEQLYVVLAVD